MKKQLYENYVSTGQSRQMDLNAEYIFTRKTFFSLKGIFANHFTHKNMSILDVGCGNGAYIYILNKLGYTDTFGIDLSEQQIEDAHRIGLTEVQCMDLFTFFSTTSKDYNLIILSDILEHLTWDQIDSLLEQAKQRLVKGNGALLIHVPNAESPFGMRIRYGDMTHETAFTDRSITQLLKLKGFKTVTAFEDPFPVYNVKSFLQKVYWKTIAALFRSFLIAESGKNNNYLLTQNLFAIARN